MKSFIELVKGRRSIRKYKQTSVEKEKVDEILQVALMSPASKRSNPWEFIVVDNKDTIKRLSKSKPHGSGFLLGAPLAIVVCADPKKSDVWIEDSSIASILVQMAAQDLGLGSCWIQIRKRPHDDETNSDEYIKDILQIPDNLFVESIIAIGYADEEKAPFNDENLLKERLHHDTFLDKWKLD